MDIKMFRTILGEDIIAEFIGNISSQAVFINAIQLRQIQTKGNETSYAFFPFPEYAKPNSPAEIKFNPNKIEFYIDIDSDFLEQYNSIFANVVTEPIKQIILG